MDSATLKTLARLIRYYILTSTTAAGSGHPTTSLSATDLMTVLFFKYLRADLDQPQHPANDRVIFSKGHASPLLYALYAAAGALTEQELLKLRTFDSPLEGHPVPRFRFTEAATGSLGQGLSVGVGEALRWQHQRISASARQRNNNDAFDAMTPLTPHVYVLLGDGELAEGSVWEAAAAASYYKLNNLVAIADVNGLGQSQETMYNRDISVYAKRFESFGWRVITVEDGHDLTEIDNAFRAAVSVNASTRQRVNDKAMTHGSNDALKPTIIIARTVKGKGVSFLEGKHGWHGKALSKEELGLALKELGKIDKSLRGMVGKAQSYQGVRIRGFGKSLKPNTKYANPNTYDKPTATRRAFGNALVRMGTVDPAMVVLDADVQNSTYTEFFGKSYPDRFFQMYIAEQTMVGVALGLAKQGFNPYIATFACFLTRAFDQVRMAALSQADIKICGSHAGVSIGQDGGSQMGLEDLAMFRAVHGSTVLYPSDPYQTERLVEAMAQTKGVVYMRTTRGETPIVYGPNDTFSIGSSRVFYAPSINKEELGGRNYVLGKRKSQTQIHNTNPLIRESVTVVAAGITLHEALKAQKQLAEEGIAVRVIDCYSVKPIDEKTLQRAAKETKAIIIVEDHYPEGGLGEAVLSALSVYKVRPLKVSFKQLLNKVSPLKVVHLAVHKTPRSAKPAELLAYEEIDAAAIVKAVRSLGER